MLPNGSGGPAARGRWAPKRNVKACYQKKPGMEVFYGIHLPWISRT